MESQRDSCVLKLAERSARDDEIIALANAALETCVSDDDITELPEGYHLSPEETEGQGSMYRQEIKRRLEKLIDERKAAAINEAKDILVSLASMGKNAKEKRREVKKIIQERKRGEKIQGGPRKAEKGAERQAGDPHDIHRPHLTLGQVS